MGVLGKVERWRDGWKNNVSLRLVGKRLDLIIQSLESNEAKERRDMCESWTFLVSFHLKDLVRKSIGIWEGDRGG